MANQNLDLNTVREEIAKLEAEKKELLLKRGHLTKEQSDRIAQIRRIIGGKQAQLKSAQKQ